jgi:hypothetical protein
MRQLLRRAWYLIRQRRFDADLREELEFHRAATESGRGESRVRGCSAPCLFSIPTRFFS